MKIKQKSTGFMFLISWRGYWQELIETITWAHSGFESAPFMTGEALK